MFETARGVSAPHSIAIAWYKVIKNERSDPRSVLRELAKVPISDLSRLETRACLQMTQESVIDLSGSLALWLSLNSAIRLSVRFLPPMRSAISFRLCTSDHFSAGDHPIFGRCRGRKEEEEEDDRVPPPPAQKNPS